MTHDVLCVGELLVDLTSDGYADSLADAGAFRAHAGGSPANLAVNLRHLGVASALAATVGRDAFGGFLREGLRDGGLHERHVATDPDLPSTLVLVTKTTGSPDFEVYRGADQRLSPKQLARAADATRRIFHTTCFALSGTPGGAHVLAAAEAFLAAAPAERAGPPRRLSIDANYAEKVWPDRREAQQTVERYVRDGALVKMSEVDFRRLYGERLTPGNCDRLGQRLIAAGAHWACFTFGAGGATVLARDGKPVHLPAEPLREVVDATGAGDSFWAGFLAAYVDGRDRTGCLRAGLAVAAHKLQRQGPLDRALDWRALVDAGAP